MKAAATTTIDEQDTANVRYIRFSLRQILIETILKKKKTENGASHCRDLCVQTDTQSKKRRRALSRAR